MDDYSQMPVNNLPLPATLQNCRFQLSSFLFRAVILRYPESIALMMGNRAWFYAKAPKKYQNVIASLTIENIKPKPNAMASASIHTKIT